KLHRDLPPTKLYAYGRSAATAHYPGPTLVAQRGVPTQVYWENHLTDRHHMFPVDYTLDDVPRPLLGGIPIVTHRHGGEQASFSDGHPEAWFTQYSEVGRAFRTRLYRYPNHQLPTTLVPRPHRRHHPPQRRRWRRRLLCPHGPAWRGEDPPVAAPGGVLRAAGSVGPKVWPYLNVRRALYRFRVLGAANTCFFNLRFVCATPRKYPHFTPPFSGDKLPIIVIGSDGGYLPRPAVRTSLLVAPGERYDILVDFSSLRSSCADVILTNDARAPFPAGEPVTNDTAVVMRFIVDHHSARLPAPRIPNTLVVSAPAPAWVYSLCAVSPGEIVCPPCGHIPGGAGEVDHIGGINRPRHWAAYFWSTQKSFPFSLCTRQPVPPVDTSQVVLERWITAVEESDPATGLPIRLLLDGLPYSALPTETPRECAGRTRRSCGI
ncbi:unnamed protein product, partial [Closterium sp. NIES-64]